MFHSTSESIPYKFSLGMNTKNISHAEGIANQTMNSGNLDYDVYMIILFHSPVLCFFHDKNQQPCVHQKLTSTQL